jgi:hypothetical protein
MVDQHQNTGDEFEHPASCAKIIGTVWVPRENTTAAGGMQSAIRTAQVRPDLLRAKKGYCMIG